MINSWPLSSKLVLTITCHCDWVNYLTHFQFLIITSWPRLRILNSYFNYQVGMIWTLFISVSSVQFSHSVISDSVTQWTAASQASLSITTPGACSNACPSSQWYHPTISSSIVPFSSCLQSFPNQGPFQWVSSLHQVAKVLEFQLQHQSFQWIFRTLFF